MREGGVIRRFDPWRSPLCTCPPKYSLSPYTGCGHACVYCYITSYIPQAFRPRVKKDIVKRVIKDAEVIDRRVPIELSASSDPYTPMERTLEITRRILQILADRGVGFMIQTKSDLVLRDADIIASARAVVGITVTTLSSKAAELEPGAPSPRRRLEVLRQLSNKGIRTIARVDPIMPGVNDREMPELVEQLASSGVRHIVGSTFKARPDGLKRMHDAGIDASRGLKELYSRTGTRISNSRYLDRHRRREILTTLREIVLQEDMSFATCREGFDDLRTSPSCDGTYLIPW